MRYFIREHLGNGTLTMPDGTMVPIFSASSIKEVAPPKTRLPLIGVFEFKGEIRPQKKPPRISVD